MNTLLLGAQLLSNLINTISPLSDEDSFGELLANCKDAVEEVMDPIIIFAIKKIGNKIYVCIYDNGHSMEPQGMFMASKSSMKKKKRGKFFKGGLKSLLSLCPERVYEFTKKIDNTQKMCIYKIKNMIDKTREMFSSGCSSDEVNTTITSQQYIIGPRVKGDIDNGITDGNYETSLDIFGDIPEIKSFKESGNIQGTCLVLEFSKDTNIIEKLDNFLISLPYTQKGNQMIKYYKDSILQEIINLSNNPYEQNIVIDSPFIYDIKEKKLYLNRNNGKRYLVEHINGKNSYEESNGNYDTSNVEKLSHCFTILSEDMSKKQLNILPINNNKVLRQIFIETDHLYLGFGGKVTIPSKFLGRSSSSSRAAPIHSRSCIKISEECENLYRILGINEEKNTPKMNKSDNPIVDAILQYTFDFKEFIENKIGVFLNKGESKNLYKEFLDNGYEFLDGQMCIKDKFLKIGLCEKTSQYINHDEIYKRLIDHKRLEKLFKDEWKENLIKPLLKKEEEIDTESESEAEESGVESDATPVAEVEPVAEESGVESAAAPVAEVEETEVEETEVEETEVEETEVEETEVEETETESEIVAEERISSTVDESENYLEGEHGRVNRQNDSACYGDAPFIETTRDELNRMYANIEYTRRDELARELDKHLWESINLLEEEAQSESPKRFKMSRCTRNTQNINDPIIRLIELEKLVRQKYYEICGRNPDGQPVKGGCEWKKLYEKFIVHQ